MPATATYNKTISAPIGECPVCGGDVWDNRTNKKNPKSPDYKCKADGDHAFWLAKQNSAPAPARSRPAPVNNPPHIPEIDGPEDAIPPDVQGDPLEIMGALYLRCSYIGARVLAARCKESGVALTPEAISAATATLFIQATQRGIR